MKKFTQQEDDFLRANYLAIPTKRMSTMLGRSESSARQRLHLLGLQVPPAIVDGFKKNSQFKKGQIPKNKGKPMSADLYNKVKATMFKKGNQPHNTAAANGVISIRKDKTGRLYKYIRVALGKWELYHRFIWEQANGSIPEGMMVAFKDGDTMNCTLENLEVITMAENMARNTIQRFPTELKQVIQLNHKLKRKINEQSKAST